MSNQTREVTLEELRQMLINNEISTEQYTQILTDNFGAEKVASCLQETMKEVYGKDILTKEVPENLKKTFGV